MISKISWHKKYLENAKNRIWALSFVSLLLFVQLPLTAVALITRDSYEYLYQSGLAPEVIRERMNLMMANSFTASISAENPAVIFEYCMIALGLAMSGFSYLYRSREVDFYHSLPVKRDDLFVQNYVIGALFFLIPYAVNLGLAVLIMLTRVGGALAMDAVLKAFVIHSVYFLFIYGVFILAVMLTGSLLTGILGGLILAAYGSLLTALIAAYMQAFQLTRIWDNRFFEKLWAITSPAGLYLYTAYTEHTALYLLIGAAGAVLAAVISLLLYRRRMLEAAGRAMAFRKTEPVIKYLIAAPAAAAGGIMIYYIMSMDGWAIFSIVFCGLIAGFVIEIIYQGDFRRLFHGKISTALAVATALLIFAVFRLDLVGYDSYRPKAENVAGVSIYIEDLSPDTQWNYYAKPQISTNPYEMQKYVNFVQPEQSDLLRMLDMIDDPALADPLIERGLEETAYSRSCWNGYRSTHRWQEAAYTESGDHYSNVLVRWALKNGGETLRIYRVNTTGLRREIEALYADQGFLKANYPVLKLNASDIAAVNYCEWNEPVHVEFAGGAEKDQLFETWKKEYSALTAETRECEDPVGALQFKTNEIQAMIDEVRAVKSDYTVFNDYYYYPVYPSFKETIALLDKSGIRAGQKISAGDIGRIMIDYYGPLYGDWDELAADDMPVTAAEMAGASADMPAAAFAETGVTLEADGRHLVLTDETKIREMMDVCVQNSTGTANPFRPKTNLLSIEAAAVTDSGRTKLTLPMSVPADLVPAFVTDYFGLDPEALKKDRSGLW